MQPVGKGAAAVLLASLALPPSQQDEIADMFDGLLLQPDSGENDAGSVHDGSGLEPVSCALPVPWAHPNEDILIQCLRWVLRHVCGPKVW